MTLALGLQKAFYEVAASVVEHHPCQSQTGLSPSHPARSLKDRSIHDAPSTTQEGVLGFRLESLGLPGRSRIASASVPPHGLEI